KHRKEDAIFEHMSETERKQRNLQLVATMKKMLNNDVEKFKEFGAVSRGFQKEQVMASEYYRFLIGMFGSEHSKQLIPEMVGLMPEGNKKQADALRMCHEMYHSTEFDRGAKKDTKLKFKE